MIKKYFIYDDDGTILRTLKEPAVVFDIITKELLHIGEYDHMEQLYYKKQKELETKGRHFAAHDLCIYSLDNQEQINTIWKTGKVVILQ